MGKRSGMGYFTKQQTSHYNKQTFGQLPWNITNSSQWISGGFSMTPLIPRKVISHNRFHAAIYEKGREKYCKECSQSAKILLSSTENPGQEYKIKEYLAFSSNRVCSECFLRIIEAKERESSKNDWYNPCVFCGNMHCENYVARFVLTVSENTHLQTH